MRREEKRALSETSSEMHFASHSLAPLGWDKDIPLLCTHSSSVMPAKQPGREKKTFFLKFSLFFKKSFLSELVYLC